MFSIRVQRCISSVPQESERGGGRTRRDSARISWGIFSIDLAPCGTVLAFIQALNGLLEGHKSVNRCKGRGPMSMGSTATAAEATASATAWNFAKFRKEVEATAAGYGAAEPFPHAVFRDMLNLEPSAMADFPDPEWSS